jgi:hypothetical protein
LLIQAITATSTATGALTNKTLANKMTGRQQLDGYMTPLSLTLSLHRCYDGFSGCLRP